MFRPRTTIAFATAIAAAATLAAPAAAQAHGLVQRADLPLPEWLFGWAAGVVLLVSFVALAVLWPSPKLEAADGWRALGPAGRLVAGRATQAACGAIGALLFVVVIWSGLAGTQTAQANFTPTFVYVVFWVGLVPTSVLFGDVFRAFNPWRAVGSAVEALVRRGTPRPYPQRLGHWPAAAGLLAFAWMELAFSGRDIPHNIAMAALVYTAVTAIGIARYGTVAWIANGEAFSVYFGLFSRLSMFETRDGVVGVRPPLSGLTALRGGPGVVGVLCVMIGAVTFDGFSQGAIWKTLGPQLQTAAASLGFVGTAAEDAAATVGLLAAVALVSAFYAAGVIGARSVGGGLSAGRLRSAFAHSLVPIAVVYVLAHNLTLVVFQGQAMQYLASDPLGTGWNLFGTAQAAINYGVLSQNATWYLQVGFVVAGHVAALALAHDRALTLYPSTKLAVRSQYWMLGVMVGFTTLALWLLAQAGA